MADTQELTIRLAQIEKDLEQEMVQRRADDKYMRRVVEDVQARYQDIALSFARIEAAFTQHLEDDKKMADSISSMDERMRKLEWLTAVAVGGVAVVGGLVTVFGVYIISILGR